MSKILEENRLEDIQIGDSRKFTTIISESMMDKFAEISGDYNPLHTDYEYAKAAKFQNRVVHGMLLSSLFSRLVGMHIPGKNALYFSQSLKFVNPCFPNENVTVEGYVINKSTATRLITIRTTVTDSNNKLLIEGEAKVIVRDS
jgi:acyl dehydratase